MRFIGIDPATKTGFVAIDERGIVLKQKELTGVGAKDPKRMITLIDEIIAHVRPGDVICIEGFPFSTQRAIFAGGLHHGIRNELFKRNFPYFEIAPNAVKKFVSVTGWTGEKGSKKRLTGTAKKRAVMKAVEEHFAFTHPSDNVVDAYVLAEIAKALWLSQKVPLTVPDYQQEVINAVTNTNKTKIKGVK